MAGVPVRVRLNRHEFKFGCALFLLDQFGDEHRNRLYREKFAQIFETNKQMTHWLLQNLDQMKTLLQ